jgi:hypothetical protein
MLLGTEGRGHKSDLAGRSGAMVIAALVYHCIVETSGRGFDLIAIMVASGGLIRAKDRKCGPFGPCCRQGGKG